MNLALINIKELVTVAAHGHRLKRGKEMLDLHILNRAAVLIEGDTIKWTGHMEELSMGSMKDTEVLDCQERIVMPGFVDSHTHLLYAGSREHEFALRSAGATYQEIALSGGGILSTVRSVRETTKKDLKKNARRWLGRMMRQGTTTVEIKSGYGLDVDNELKMLEAINELREEEVITVVPTFLGAHAVPPEFSTDKGAYVKLILDRMMPMIGKRKLAAFCDVFCEDGYFSADESREILVKAKGLGMEPKIHADELSASGGSEIAAELQAVSADHLENISGKGIEHLSRTGVIATLLPGVSFMLHHRHAPARRLIDAGVPVAIATDFNPGSCMSYSMPLMMTIACAQMAMSPEEAITASTLNAAAALNLSGEVGSIEVGKKADLLILSIPNYQFLPYHFGENHVVKVIKNGVVLEY